MRKTDLFTSRGAPNLRSYRRTGFLAESDALAFLRSLRSCIGDIVFLDPPFNLGKDYGVTSSIESGAPAEYDRYMRRTIEQAERVLKPGGALFLYHIPIWAARFAGSMMRRLQFRHWIAISMKNGFVRGKRLYPAHYALLYYTKGEPGSFHRPRLAPARCRKCRVSVKDYGGYTSIVEEKGVNLSDFWDDLSPVRHKSTKHRKANQLPLGLTDRVVAIAGCPGGLLIDPFAGAGTSLVSAARAGMSFLGNDLAPANVNIAMSRLDAL